MKMFLFFYKYVGNFGCFLDFGDHPYIRPWEYVHVCQYCGRRSILHQFSKLGMQKGAFCVSGINSNMKMNRPRLDKSRGIRHLKGRGSNSSPVGKEKKSKGLISRTIMVIYQA